MELWGCASKSNTVIMQRSQSKILRTIENTCWYVTNHNLHTDFNIPYVSDVIHERNNKYHNKLEAHPNPLLQPLLHPINTRRPKSGESLSYHSHIELWGCASKSNIIILQRCQSKISQSHSKCTLECNKSYSTYRLQHPLRKRRHPRKNQ